MTSTTPTAVRPPQAQTLLDLVTAEPARLRRRAVSLGIHPDEADDLAQTVLLRAWQALDGVRDAGAGTVCAWVDAIARNTAVDHLRARREALPLGDDADPRLAAPAADAQLDVRAQLRAALRAIEQLPDSLRTPLVLSAVDGRSGDEIARLLGIAPALVRQRISRARRRLASTA